MYARAFTKPSYLEHKNEKFGLIGTALTNFSTRVKKVHFHMYWDV